MWTDRKKVEEVFRQFGWLQAYVRPDQFETANVERVSAQLLDWSPPHSIREFWNGYMTDPWDHSDYYFSIYLLFDEAGNMISEVGIVPTPSHLLPKHWFWRYLLGKVYQNPIDLMFTYLFFEVFPILRWLTELVFPEHVKTPYVYGSLCQMMYQFDETIADAIERMSSLGFEAHWLVRISERNLTVFKPHKKFPSLILLVKDMHQRAVNEVRRTFDAP